MKLIMESWRNYLLEQTIVEATDEEIETIKPALDIPKEKLPFNDIFNGKYRKLITFKGNDPKSEFSKFLKFLEFTGWSLKPSDASLAIKSRETLYIAKPNEGVKSKTTIEEVKLAKLVQEMKYQFTNKFVQYSKLLLEIKQKMDSLVKEKFDKKYKGKGFKKEWHEDKEYLKLHREKLSLTNSLEKYINRRSSHYLFSKIYDNDIPAIEKVLNENLIPKSEKYFNYLVDNIEIFIGKTIEEMSNKINYVMLSRHPVDVFRMSDHVGMNSCHALPHGKEGKWDEYNICAMAEAHGNGMIAYIIEAQEFKDFGIEPTQEALDKYEDKEILYDEDRGLDGLVPESRIRIRNVGILNDKYSHYDIENRIAVPDGKMYGEKLPGFVDFLYRYISIEQKDKLQDIIDKSNGNIDFSNFLRVGGSYQDSGYAVQDNMPKMISLIAPEKEIQFFGSVQYSSDLEDSLASEYRGTTIEDAREILNNLINRYGNNTVVLDSLDVEEDFGGDGFYMTGDVKLIWEYGDKIQFYDSQGDVEALIEEAVTEYLSSIDEIWDPYVHFMEQYAGYNNVMTIDVPISSYEHYGNYDYHLLDPNTWEEAVRELSTNLYSAVDRHVDDSLNNFVLHYISHYPETVRTIVTSEYAVALLKDKLEEDATWKIKDVEIDEEFPLHYLGIDKITGFMAEFNADAWLGDLFNELYEQHADDDFSKPETIEAAKKLSMVIINFVNALKSDKMNIFKASLLDTDFAKEPKLYERISNSTILNEMDMSVITITDGADITTPEQVLTSIMENQDLDLTIKIKVDKWSHVDVAYIGKMMLGTFRDNVGWHTDSDETVKAIILSDAATKPPTVSESKRKRKIKILKG